MIQKLLLVVGLLLSGCASNIGTTNNSWQKYWTHPDRIKCPEDYVAYCEGRTRSTMECTCIGQNEVRYIYEGLYR
jgi:hypothetical protein